VAPSFRGGKKKAEAKVLIALKERKPVCCILLSYWEGRRGVHVLGFVGVLSISFLLSGNRG